jgi:hypothetical protein
MNHNMDLWKASQGAARFALTHRYSGEVYGVGDTLRAAIDAARAKGEKP